MVIFYSLYLPQTMAAAKPAAGECRGWSEGHLNKRPGFGAFLILSNCTPDTCAGTEMLF
jgi:hypothetical protein